MKQYLAVAVLLGILYFQSGTFLIVYTFSFFPVFILLFDSNKTR